MRKKVSIVLFVLMVMVALSACGEKDEPTNTPLNEITSENEVLSTKETNNNIVEPSEVTTKEDTENVDINNNTQLVDWVIGEDIAVSERPDSGAFVSNLPTIHFLLPPKDNIVETTILDNGSTKYTISASGIDRPIVIYASIQKGSDDYCSRGYHKETVDNGRYCVDIGNMLDNNYTDTSTTIIDNQTGWAITIVMDVKNGYEKDVSESDINAYKELYELNIEYIKEQVSGWDANYTAPQSNSEEDDWVQGYINDFYGIYNNNAGYATVEIIPNTNDGNDTLIATDIANSTTYECELVPAGDNYFQAMYNGEVALNIETTGTGLFIDIDIEEYVNLYGEYSKQ